MASQPAPNALPIFYGGLEPLSSNVHPNHRNRQADRAPFLSNAHAVPITIDEFVSAQRNFPIVFSSGEGNVPLALMGLNEGVNVFVDSDGKVQDDIYVPAYVRRYPYMLARLQPDAQELSLCFDPTSGLVGEFDEGEKLFDDGTPSETTNNILRFCEEFELSAQRTQNFMNDLKETGLLMDGEVSIQPNGAEQPFLYRGFQMVDEEKLRNLSDEEASKLQKNGMLALIYAHLFSVQLIRDVFAKQLMQGKGPQVPQAGAAAAPAGNA
ncbi:MAG TPA: SapC family protein [Allosphingosinicella sp.]|nr:SapC family protein [Allosphingosinicella sp.]